MQSTQWPTVKCLTVSLTVVSSSWTYLLNLPLGLGRLLFALLDAGQVSPLLFRVDLLPGSGQHRNDQAHHRPHPMQLLAFMFDFATSL